MNELRFFWGFLLHPKQVSAVLPTGPRSAKRIVGMLPNAADTIVEYGPGVGTVAEVIVRSEKLKKDGVLILIERSDIYVKQLQKKFVSDPRVHVVRDSAENVENILRRFGRSHADCIITSIPLSIMDEGTRGRILKATKRVLGSDGMLLVYLYRKRVGGYLREYFPNVEQRKILKNIPPLRVFVSKNAVGR